MRVAIVTLPLLSNFGGILQNFALQTALKSLGHMPVTIDYDVSPSIFRQGLRCAKVLIQQGRHFKMPSMYKRNKHVAPFIEKNILLTERTKTYNKPSLRKYEAYVVGSDQVWRYSYSKPVIKDVYLKFTEGLACKRISYAASFGSSSLDYPEKIIKQCKDLIKEFDAVSVREETGVKICRDIFNQQAELVIDPTLLNDKEVYYGLCQGVPTQKSILLAYVLDMTPQKLKLIQKTASEKKLEPIIVSEKREGGITIEEWLAYFRDAEFVFTDSFHGTVFSIIFEKDFVTLNNTNRGTDRFLSLLNRFLLEDRLINNAEIDTLKDINWDKIREIKTEVANYGLNFLRNSLS